MMVLYFSKTLNCVISTCNGVFLELLQSPTFDHDSRHGGGLPFNVEGRDAVLGRVDEVAAENGR